MGTSSFVKTFCLVTLPLAIACAPYRSSTSGDAVTDGSGSGSGSGSYSVNSGSGSGSGSGTGSGPGGFTGVGGGTGNTVSSGTGSATPVGNAGPNNIVLTPAGVGFTHPNSNANSDSTASIGQANAGQPPAAPQSAHDLQVIVVNSLLIALPAASGCAGSTHSYHAFGIPMCPSGYIAISVAANCEQGQGGNLLAMLMFPDLTGAFVDCCITDNGTTPAYNAQVGPTQVVCAKKAF